MKSKNKPTQTKAESAHVSKLADMSRLSIKLQQRGQDIQGRIELPPDNLFTMECLAMVVEQLATQTGVPAAEVVNDLFCIVMGHIAKKTPA